MRIALTLASLLLLAQPAWAKDTVLDIQEITSPGGIKAWLVEDHSVPVIALKFAFRKAGAVQDSADKQGLARLLSNTLDEGAGDLTSQEFQKELQDLVIELKFSAGRDDFVGNLKTLTQNKERAFELTKLALTQPRFDEAPVQRMREANQSRLRTSLTDPEWVAARFLNDRAFEGHAYAQNSGGTISSFDTITIDELKNFHQTHIGKNNLVVSAAGDITAEELKAVIDQIFGTLPEVIPAKIPRAKLNNAGKVFVHKKEIPQTIIEMMQTGIDRKDPNYQTAQIMNFVLGSSGFGSRLTKEIREKRGLTYGIYSYFHDLEQFDGLAVSTSTKNASVPEMLALIKQEWDKMKNVPISQDEIESAQSYLIGALPLSLTSTDKIAGLLLSLQLDDLPTDYLDQRQQKIKATTRPQVQELAQTLLNHENFITILVGQPEGLDSAETLETIPNVE